MSNAPAPYDQAKDVVLSETDAKVLAELQTAIAAMPWIDDEDSSVAVSRQVLAAQTKEEVAAELTGRSVTKLGLQDAQMTIDKDGIALAPSDYDQVLKFYAVVSATLEDGEQVTFGAGGLLATQLVRWYSLDEQGENIFPVHVKILEIPSRKPGRNPALRFVLV